MMESSSRDKLKNYKAKIKLLESRLSQYDRQDVKAVAFDGNDPLATFNVRDICLYHSLLSSTLLDLYRLLCDADDEELKSVDKDFYGSRSYQVVKRGLSISSHALDINDRKYQYKTLNIAFVIA